MPLAVASERGERHEPGWRPLPGQTRPTHRPWSSPASTDSCQAQQSAPTPPPKRGPPPPPQQRVYAAAQHPRRGDQRRARGQQARSGLHDRRRGQPLAGQHQAKGARLEVPNAAVAPLPAPSPNPPQCAHASLPSRPRPVGALQSSATSCDASPMSWLHRRLHHRCHLPLQSIAQRVRRRAAGQARRGQRGPTPPTNPPRAATPQFNPTKPPVIIRPPGCHTGMPVQIQGGRKRRNGWRSGQWACRIDAQVRRE